MSRKIRKILIANRGEIARRVMRTCREMGIVTVAVYSDADAGSPHVKEADEAFHIGGSPATESYLRAERILDAARAAAADAVHPGYGFLSENPAFVDAVEAAGLTFIGPSSDAMRRLGDKTSARALARQVGVPIVPGTVEPLAGSEEACTAAGSIGYPILLKAAAGGGGKGMRIVRSPEELPSSFAQARSEARSSFSDDRVYLEKYIDAPRHVEVQILADSGGRVLHLGERECSIQRRHQKIIEESPSPAVTAKIRKGLTEAATALAAHVGYTGAGTVEFLLDRNGTFYFMEVNARLQVEHPVTEMRTGLDLVREQIRVASGEELSAGQEEIAFRGHAVECRIYAEDSANAFLPSTGTIGHIVHPRGPGIRLETGIEGGSVISPFYDPMISKVIAHAPTRGKALERMRAALAECDVRGVRTNLDLLLWILEDPDFAAGEFDTGFLDRKYKPEHFGRVPGEAAELASLVAAYLHLRNEERLIRSGASVDPGAAGRMSELLR